MISEISVKDHGPVDPVLDDDPMRSTVGAGCAARYVVAHYEIRRASEQVPSGGTDRAAQ